MKLNHFLLPVLFWGFMSAVICRKDRSAVAAPAQLRASSPSASFLFSSAVRAFWAVEPRQQYSFDDYDRLEKLEVLPANDPDAARYRHAAQLFEKFIAVDENTNGASDDERLAIAHYFAGMAWFRIGAWQPALSHIETVLQKWPDYARPRLGGEPDLRRPVRADLLSLRFYIQLQLHPLAKRLKTTEPLSILKALAQEASDALDVIAPRDAQWASVAAQKIPPVWAELDVTEPQPGQLRAAALPSVLQMVENAYAELLPKALAKSGPQGVRSHLRELQGNAHFTALARKLLLGIDDQIVKSYFASAQALLNSHNYDGARAVYKKIQVEYPDSDAAQRATDALPKIVPVAVNYYKSEGEKNFRTAEPDQFMKAQTQSREFYEKAYKEDPDGPQSAEMLYGWARGLATEKGHVPDAIKLMELWMTKYPQKQPLRVKAMWQLAFFYATQGSRYADGIKLMEQIVREYPDSPEAAESLWHAAFLQSALTDGSKEGYAKGLPYLEKYYKDYPNAPRWPNALKWINRFKEKLHS